MNTDVIKFSVFKDFKSIQFIRCVTQIPGSEYGAEGTSFNFNTAIEKCRSELIERSFLLSRGDRAQILGIAAHPIKQKALEHAENELLETLAIEKMSRTLRFQGVPIINFKEFKCWLKPINKKFFVIIYFKQSNSFSAVHAVSKNIFSALLKAWVEYRNIVLFEPSLRELRAYTKANKILGPEGLIGLRFEFRKMGETYPYQNIDSFTFFSKSRFISFFKRRPT